jgi:hypothetical protein
MGINLGGLLQVGAGILTQNPAIIASGVGSTLLGGGPSGLGNIGGSDPTLAAQQALDQQYEWAQLGMNAENMRHQLELQQQSTMFNEFQDERSEQMREMNLMRDVAMKQREADNAIVKEFLRTIKD